MSQLGLPGYVEGGKVIACTALFQRSRIKLKVQATIRAFSAKGAWASRLLLDYVV
jgi:hypothetical protein